MPTFRPLAALLTLALAALAFVAPAQAQTGQSLYVLHCQGCHGNPSQNNDGVLGGKDWNIIKLAMDTRPDMTAVLRPLYNAGLLTDEDFQKIATYLQGFAGGAVSRHSRCRRRSTSAPWPSASRARWCRATSPRRRTQRGGRRSRP